MGVKNKWVNLVKEMSKAKKGKEVKDRDGSVYVVDKTAVINDPVRNTQQFSDKPMYEGQPYSTHLMADDDNLTAWPTLFQDEEGNWYRGGRKEAEKRGEIYKFDTREEMINFARKGNWKKHGGNHLENTNYGLSSQLEEYQNGGDADNPYDYARSTGDQTYTQDMIDYIYSPRYLYNLNRLGYENPQLTQFLRHHATLNTGYKYTGDRNAYYDMRSMFRDQTPYAHIRLLGDPLYYGGWAHPNEITYGDDARYNISGLGNRGVMYHELGHGSGGVLMPGLYGLGGTGYSILDHGKMQKHHGIRASNYFTNHGKYPFFSTWDQFPELKNLSFTDTYTPSGLPDIYAGDLQKYIRMNKTAADLLRKGNVFWEGTNTFIGYDGLTFDPNAKKEYPVDKDGIALIPNKDFNIDHQYADDITSESVEGWNDEYQRLAYTDNQMKEYWDNIPIDELELWVDDPQGSWDNNAINLKSNFYRHNLKMLNQEFYRMTPYHNDMVKSVGNSISNDDYAGVIKSLEQMSKDKKTWTRKERKEWKNLMNLYMTHYNHLAEALASEKDQYWTTHNIQKGNINPTVQSSTLHRTGSIETYSDEIAVNLLLKHHGIVDTHISPDDPNYEPITIDHLRELQDILKKEAEDDDMSSEQRRINTLVVDRLFERATDKDGNIDEDAILNWLEIVHDDKNQNLGTPDDGHDYGLARFGKELRANNPSVNFYNAIKGRNLDKKRTGGSFYKRESYTNNASQFRKYRLGGQVVNLFKFKEGGENTDPEDKGSGPLGTYEGIWKDRVFSDIWDITSGLPHMDYWDMDHENTKLYISSGGRSGHPVFHPELNKWRSKHGNHSIYDLAQWYYYTQSTIPIQEYGIIQPDQLKDASNWSGRNYGRFWTMDAYGNYNFDQDNYDRVMDLKKSGHPDWQWLPGNDKAGYNQAFSMAKDVGMVHFFWEGSPYIGMTMEEKVKIDNKLNADYVAKWSKEKSPQILQWEEDLKLPELLSTTENMSHFPTDDEGTNFYTKLIDFERQLALRWCLHYSSFDNTTAAIKTSFGGPPERTAEDCKNDYSAENYVPQGNIFERFYNKDKKSVGIWNDATNYDNWEDGGFNQDDLAVYLYAFSNWVGMEDLKEIDKVYTNYLSKHDKYRINHKDLSNETLTYANANPDYMDRYYGHMTIDFENTDQAIKHLNEIGFNPYGGGVTINGKNALFSDANSQDLTNMIYDHNQIVVQDGLKNAFEEAHGKINSEKQANKFADFVQKRVDSGLYEDYVPDWRQLNTENLSNVISKIGNPHIYWNHQQGGGGYIGTPMGAGAYNYFTSLPGKHTTYNWDGDTTHKYNYYGDDFGAGTYGSVQNPMYGTSRYAKPMTSLISFENVVTTVTGTKLFGWAGRGLLGLLGSGLNKTKKYWTNMGAWGPVGALAKTVQQPLSWGTNKYTNSWINKKIMSRSLPGTYNTLNLNNAANVYFTASALQESKRQFDKGNYGMAGLNLGFAGLTARVPYTSFKQGFGAKHMPHLSGSLTPGTTFYNKYPYLGTTDWTSGIRMNPNFKFKEWNTLMQNTPTWSLSNKIKQNLNLHKIQGFGGKSLFPYTPTKLDYGNIWQRALERERLMKGQQYKNMENILNYKSK